MKTGVELIAIERQEQIEKHGYTVELADLNPQWYNDYQLSRVASLLCSPETGNLSKVCPIDTAIAFGYIENWDADWLRYTANKPYKERLIIAGALLAAEIDRIKQLK